MFYFGYRIITQEKIGIEYAKKIKIVTDDTEGKNRIIEGRKPDILEKRIINFEEKIIVLENRLDLLEKYAKEINATTHKEISDIVEVIRHIKGHDDKSGR